ncbi:ATP-binding protein [Methylobacterium sp. E-025]|uniref:ATP-binding protein n=1 Tax=Methylobacterium sp. E-025 TaxID=2836561 RepID=UPI001FBB5708|nr:ATP-binding protein [Methylobacterium sp. E-025]MCJ2111236.1 ATP-binding protein [Methylobacterium sp. E-025]
MTAPDPMSGSCDFLAGAGEMATLMRAYDWTTTPLGKPEGWPSGLRTAVRLLLNSHHPMHIFWGLEATFFYNDPFVPSAGPERHPSALGRPASESWGEIWPVIGFEVAKVRNGGGHTWYEDQHVPILREGRVEDAYWTYGLSPIDDDTAPNGIGGVISILTETTKRKALEDSLRASNRRQRSLLQQIPGFVAVLEGPDLVYAYVNDAYVATAGARGYLGRTVRDVFPELEGQGFFELLDEVYATGVPFSAQDTPIRFVDEDEDRYIDFLFQPIREQNGPINGILVGGHEVTARVRAEAALRAEMDQARHREVRAQADAERVQLALGAGAILGTWHWDLPTDRFTVDEGFAGSFGLDPALGTTGIPLAQIVATVHPDDQAGLAKAINDAIQRGGAYAHQYRVRRTDGRYYWIEANGRVDRAEDGTPSSFPGVLIDVEERRAILEERDRAAAALRTLNETLEQRVAERTTELMRAEEALRQSQKMEAVGQLTGGLAHDFNNLLAGISGSLELMQNRMQQGRLKDVDKYMVAAQGASKRAAALTHRLLAFSRRQTLDPKPTDVNRLVLGMQELIQRTAGPGSPVEVVGASGLWPALVDPSQLENALLNLCINARDAMPDGGRITVETANRWLDERAAKKQDLPEGQYLSLCVTDTGTGMPPEVIARVFEPFFTTKPTGEGTGLGLSMIYGFAKQSGGQVRIYSEVGQGSTICIYLPRHHGEAADEFDTIKLDALPRSEQEATVLIVDDEPTVRMLVTDILEDLGYLAIEAGDSAAGLKILQSDVPIDLLVTDVGLPGGMNGRQMADAGRVQRPDLKVLFITGYAENAVLGHGHLAPGMSVLTKPFAMDAMAARIRSLIEAVKEAKR